jgi:hypothetical protein
MKRTISLMGILVVAGIVSAQKLHFEPVTDGPVDFSQVTAASAYVRGNWLALDEHSKLPGVSMSEISCDHKAMICHEVQGNLVVDGNMFSLVPDVVDYQITRWTAAEIVATNVGGICKVLNSLKFDLKNKKVYALQSLSEPVEDLPKMSRDACNAVGQRLELRAATMYWQGPTLKQ